MNVELTRRSFIHRTGVADAKRAFDSARPITAIHHLFAHEEVKAWAGPYEGKGKIKGSDWRPYQAANVVTPGASRRYGGIHFAQGDLDGRAVGRQIGAQAWDKAREYIRGTA